MPLDRVWFLAPLALNRVYVCPGAVLDRVWLQDCRRVFVNPKSAETFTLHFSSQLSLHLRFTAVNAKFWDFSPSLLGSVLFYQL